MRPSNDATIMPTRSLLLVVHNIIFRYLVDTGAGKLSIRLRNTALAIDFIELFKQFVNVLNARTYSIQVAVDEIVPKPWRKKKKRN